MKAAAPPVHSRPGSGGAGQRLPAQAPVGRGIRWTGLHADLLQQQMRAAGKTPQQLARLNCVSLAQVDELMAVQPGLRFYSEDIKFVTGARLYRSVGGQLEDLMALAGPLPVHAPQPLALPGLDRDEGEAHTSLVDLDRRWRIAAWAVALVLLVAGLLSWVIWVAQGPV